MASSEPVTMSFGVTAETHSIVDNTAALTATCANRTTALPDAPVNLTLLGIFTTTVLLQWNITCDLLTTSQHNSFSIHVHPLTSEWMSDTDLLAFVVTRISGDTRQYSLQNLLPQTLYNLYLTHVNSYGSSNASDVLSFRTLSATPLEYHKIVVKPIELVLVFGILSAWFLTIVVFLRKWGTIRISQPGGHSKYHQPKNLENIKVVNTANDSVIYRSYGQGYHKTMQARQKHLDKMHTVPNVQFKDIPEETSNYDLPQPSQSPVKRERTMTERHSKSRLGKSSGTPTLKKRPKLSRDKKGIDSTVLDMFPEELPVKPDKELSIEDLAQSERTPDTEEECLPPIKTSWASPRDTNTVDTTHTPESSHARNDDVEKAGQSSETMPREMASNNTQKDSDSMAGKEQTHKCDVHFKETLSDNDSVEEVFRSTTV